MGVTKVFKDSAASPQGVAFMGLAGTAHQQAAGELGVPFIAGLLLLYSIACQWFRVVCSEWFADLDYNDEGKLLITKSVCPLFYVAFIYLCPKS